MRGPEISIIFAAEGSSTPALAMKANRRNAVSFWSEVLLRQPAPNRTSASAGRKADRAFGRATRLCLSWLGRIRQLSLERATGGAAIDGVAHLALGQDAAALAVLHAKHCTIWR